MNTDRLRKLTPVQNIQVNFSIRLNAAVSNNQIWTNQYQDYKLDMSLCLQMYHCEYLINLLRQYKTVERLQHVHEIP